MSSVGNPFLIKEMMKRAHFDEFDVAHSYLNFFKDNLSLFECIFSLLVISVSFLQEFYIKYNMNLNE